MFTKEDVALINEYEEKREAMVAAKAARDGSVEKDEAARQAKNDLQAFRCHWREIRSTVQATGDVQVLDGDAVASIDSIGVSSEVQ